MANVGLDGENYILDIIHCDIKCNLPPIQRQEDGQTISGDGICGFGAVCHTDVRDPLFTSR
jgi:hypothetical protein